MTHPTTHRQRHAETEPEATEEELLATLEGESDNEERQSLLLMAIIEALID